MKKTNQGLSSIFAIAKEMIPNHGEDSFYYRADGDSFILASMDGCGGSGSKKYENYSGKTGAYIASRAICGGIMAWFDESGNKDEISDYVNNALNVCKKYADKSGRIMGSLGKAFPTTIAALTGNFKKDCIETTCYWAGDSRCYALDSAGLHQLTADDLDGQDAMSNLTNDGAITNVVNASTPFEIHTKVISIKQPCFLFTATDGCFGYLKSPMEFEYIILESLMKSNNISEWKSCLDGYFRDVAGDDYTFCIAACGFDDFKHLKTSFIQRFSFLNNEYINNTGDVNTLWNVYSKDYSIYL
ncbi:MAG: hypothetical protein E7415_07050 [Ruminococcaceae bacterium]|nr:hypothetical protein [Oscillospiraceae bacterium]